MIGICGYLTLDGASASPATLGTMQKRLVRCGSPTHAAFVERSLAVGASGWHSTVPIDAAQALFRHQPSGCITIADARLQRRKSLVRHLGLSQDHPWTDAMLITHAWLRSGEGCVESLEGDFAFAVWDPRNQALFCARDPIGIRPLYIHHSPGRLFAFASSTPPLLAHPGIPGSIDEGRVADALFDGLEGIDKTSTFHLNIKRLPPGHSQRAGQPACRYWAFPETPLSTLPRTDRQWQDALADALENAVEECIARDAVGCMLSGGMDSSSLAVIAANQRQAAGAPALRTFSAIDNRHPNPETSAVHAMLALPSFQPHLTDHVEDGPLAELLWSGLWDNEEPFDGLMMLPNAQYIAAAEAGLVSLIDGVDGDTPFLPGSALPRLLRRGHVIQAWRTADGLSRFNPETGSTRSVFARGMRTALVPDRIRRWRRARMRPSPARPLPDSLIKPEFAERIDVGARLARLEQWMPGSPEWNRFGEARFYLDHPFITVAAERYHRVAARYGISPLHPFLDRHVLLLCLHLPDRLRMGDGYTKTILRRIMCGRLPEPVRLRRDKQHLGWSQVISLLSRRRPELRARLDAVAPALAPYAELRRMTEILEMEGDPNTAPEATQHLYAQLLTALQLGTWLKNRI